RAEPNGPRPAGLQHRKILRGDADTLRELVEAHLAPREHDVDVDDDRHVDAQIVSSASRCSASALLFTHRPTSMIHDASRTSPAVMNDQNSWDTLESIRSRGTDASSRRLPTATAAWIKTPKAVPSSHKRPSLRRQPTLSDV